MPAALLCVQFRNLLPSEELLLSARGCWTDLQERESYDADDDATLSITQTQGDSSHFLVELALPGGQRRVAAIDHDPQVAIRRVFRRLELGWEHEVSQGGGKTTHSASLGHDLSVSDTGAGSA